MVTLYNVIDECRARRPYEPEPRCVLFTGPSGSGKSFILKKFAFDTPPTGKHRSLRRHVIYVAMPPKSRSLITLAKYMLKALEVPDWDTFSGNHDAYFEYVFEQLALQRVEVVILDELQQLTESASNAPIRKAADDFKKMAKDYGIILVLAGLNDVSKLLSSNEQLGRLCCHRKEAKFFSMNSKELRIEFRDFLKMVDDGLPFDDYVKLGSGEFSKKIFKATKGCVSYVMLLIREAAFIAIDNNEHLTEKHFVVAFNKVMTEIYDGLDNPFSNLNDV